MSKEFVATLMIFICILVLAGFALLIVYIVSVHQKNRGKFIKEMEEMKINFKNEILQSELEMQEDTFESISMEIHDNISQLLSVAKLNLGRIGNLPEQDLKKIQYSVDLMSEAMYGLNDLSRRLNAEMIREEGLCVAVEEYVRQLRKSTEFEIVFNTSGYKKYFPIEKELILFRILQESVNNILKHAEANQMIIDLHFSYDSLQLSIRDNGKGFDLSGASNKSKKGAGIKNMQKRAAMFGGKFLLETGLEKGTRISIELPVIQQENIDNFKIGRRS
jgi:two-component system, NarL family, sensor kinase